ncbi:MAG: CpaF family protein, partial [Candidatus Altiarchaeales archaeon]
MVKEKLKLSEKDSNPDDNTEACESVEEKENELDSYTVRIDETELNVRIVDVGDYVAHYLLSLPEIDFVTRALLDETKRSLVSEIQLETQIMLTPDKFMEIRENFFIKAKEKLKKVLSRESEENITALSRVLVNEMIGLGDIEYLLADSMLEEIVVNSSKDVVWAYHKRYGWLKTNIQIPTEDMIRNYSARIAREVGREITHSVPLLDAHLPTGDRINATLFPISTCGNTITIRRFSRTPWTMIHLIDPEFNTISIEAAAFLWQAIEYELSMLVSGGTASGKTSMLNALMPFMPANQRIISIEDTRELNLPDFLHWVPLTTRPPNPRGEGEVSMLDLVENSLRMRPDRIVVGEVRRKRETEVLFEAMHTGHSVYGTFHANRADEVVERITSPPMNIPGIVMGSLPLIVVQ